MTTDWKPKTIKPKTPAPAKEPPISLNSNRVWGKKARQSPRHSNTVRRVLLIAKNAWEGRSASEIADELGVCVQYVYQLCSDYRIKLVPKTKAQYAFRVIINLDTLTRLETIAAERGDDVSNLVTRSIETLSIEKTLLANLLDESDDD